jgi:hypothetical protein
MPCRRRPPGPLAHAVNAAASPSLRSVTAENGDVVEAPQGFTGVVTVSAASSDDAGRSSSYVARRAAFHAGIGSNLQGCAVRRVCTARPAVLLGAALLAVARALPCGTRCMRCSRSGQRLMAKNTSRQVTTATTCWHHRWVRGAGASWGTGSRSHGPNGCPGGFASSLQVAPKAWRIPWTLDTSSALAATVQGHSTRWRRLHTGSMEHSPPLDRRTVVVPTGTDGVRRAGVDFEASGSVRSHA